MKQFKVERKHRLQAVEMAKLYLKKHELTQADLATKLDVFPGEVSNLVRGCKIPKTLVIKVINTLA